MAFIHDFHLLRPWWLLAFIPLTILFLYTYHHSIKNNPWNAICDPHLLPHLLIKNKTKFFFNPLLLLGFCWLLAIFALSGPSWKRQALPLYHTEEAQIIILDLSENMDVADIKPNRLTRAKYKVLDLLHQNKENQIGLLVFSQYPFIVSPLTEDAETIATLAESITSNTIPVKGHNIQAALKKALELFKQADVHKGHILLLTASKPNSMDQAFAKTIKQQGFTLSVLGIGTEFGAPLLTANPNDTQTMMAKLDIIGLKNLALAGGGRYISFTSTNEDILTLVKTFYPSSKKIHKTQQVIAAWKDEGYSLLLPILISAALLFRRGWGEELIR
ncbi:MAG: hypothetical protein LEGION0398_MBIBDBAK_00648 [Legionellaceae bacterium]